MKEHGGAPQDGAQPSKPKKVVTISERKLKANRENAKKSTGPRTARGKAFSRRNAIKHGLFVNYITDFEALGEDPKEFEELLTGLWEQYNPVGRAEEIEVERIAICNWRLKRSWRYENAMNRLTMHDMGIRLMPSHTQMEKVEEALLAQLRDALREIEETGQISQELNQKIRAAPGFAGEWSELDEKVQKRMEEAAIVKLNPQVRSGLPEVLFVMLAIEKVAASRTRNINEIAVGRQMILSSPSLEKVLRYETTIERYRSHAIERLERLQRRRLGEFVPPPVRVQLS